MNRSTKDLYFFKKHLFRSYIRIGFQLVAFDREHMQYKVIRMGHPMRLELIRVGEYSI